MDIILENENTINLFKIIKALLESTDRTINTSTIKDFMSNNLDQNYRRSKNSMYWFQLFLNAAWLEKKFSELNKNLVFKEQDHSYLGGDKKRGNFIPDFEYTCDLGVFDIDIKTYFRLEDFNSAGFNNFEGAKFVIAFIIAENKFYVRTLVSGTRMYSLAVDLSNIPNDLQVLKNIFKDLVLPTEVKMIYFDTDKDLGDSLIPSLINYNVKTYRVG